MSRRNLLLASLLLAPVIGFGAPPALAEPAPTPPSQVLLSATWRSTDAGFSRCSKGPGIIPTIVCTHTYSSFDWTLGKETCIYGGFKTVLRPPGECNARLGGRSSGPGVPLGENGYAPACATLGVDQPWSIDGTFGSDDIPVKITVHHGLGAFVGSREIVDGLNVLVSAVKGTFTLGCGHPLGGSRNASFAGTWTLTAS